jgi:hypothetical protein
MTRTPEAPDHQGEDLDEKIPDEAYTAIAGLWPFPGLPPAYFIGGAKERFLSGAHGYLAEKRKSLGTNSREWEVFFLVSGRLLSAVGVAFDRFAVVLDEARARKPQLQFAQVLLTWVEEAPESKALERLIGAALALSTKVVEDQDRIVEVTARALARDLIRLRRVNAEFRQRWIEPNHLAGPGGTGYLRSFVARLRSGFRIMTDEELPLDPVKESKGPLYPALHSILALSPHLADVDAIAAKALARLKDTFKSSGFDPLRKGPAKRKMRDRRFQAFAEAGFSHAEIARLEGKGVSVDAVARALSRLRKEQATPDDRGNAGAFDTAFRSKRPTAEPGTGVNGLRQPPMA